MRKVLLSTTALVAAGLLVTSVAYADEEEMVEEAAAEEEMMAEDEMMMEEEMMPAEPVSVSIGGSYRAIFGASNDDASPHMYSYLEPVLSGSATMDNGLTFGLAAVIDASSGDMLAYDRKLTVGGAFGDVAIGAIRSARGGNRIGSPGATSSFGVNFPYQPGIASVVKTNDSGHASIPSRDTKIVYTSPTVSGIQVAASYAPGGTATAAVLDVDAKSVAGQAVSVKTAAGSTATDQIAASATLTQDLGNASVSINVGYELADNAGAHPTDLNAGLSVTIDDITVGGGVRMSDDDAGNETRQSDVGASLDMGPLSLSAAWGSSDNTDMYAFGAAYPLGEGVALESQVDFGEDAMGEEWVQFMVGTVINF